MCAQRAVQDRGSPPPGISPAVSPVEISLAETSTVETGPAEINTVETSPAEINTVETSPVKTRPVTAVAAATGSTRLPQQPGRTCRYLAW